MADSLFDLTGKVVEFTMLPFSSQLDLSASCGYWTIRLHPEIYDNFKRPWIPKIFSNPAAAYRRPSCIPSP